MAGIGFLLRRLAEEDNYLGIIRAYFHSAVVAVGPWIMIVFTLGAISLDIGDLLGLKELDEFHSVFVYNVFFSFILSSPVYMLSARFVADCLYRKDPSPIPGILITSLFIVLIPAVIIATLFYVFYATMSPVDTFLSIINFVLLTQIWVIMLYLGSIRDFKAITISWLFSMVLAIFFAIYWGEIYGSTGMLMGVNIGFVLLFSSLVANILAEYPFRFLKASDFFFYFKYYKELAWGGFFLFASMWVDKIIMWTSPLATMHHNHLRTFPIYDGSLFLSYLTIIPIMALFIFGLETHFYDSYIRYIQNIEGNAPLSLIEEERKNIIRKIIDNSRNFLILQGSFSLTIILLAPTLFELTDTDFIKLTIFQVGVLGAFFAALNLFIIVLFSYFDSQRDILVTTSVMFFSNVALTIISKSLGFEFYGYGYAISMLLSFFVGAHRLWKLLNKLHYHIFITNVVVRRYSKS